MRFTFMLCAFGTVFSVFGAMDVCKSAAGASSSACMQRGQQQVKAPTYLDDLEAAENEFIQSSWESHMKKEELDVLSTTAPASFGQSVVNAVLLAWRLFGAELCVFAVTVCFALAMRNPRIAKKAAPSSPQPFCSSPSVGMANTRASAASESAAAVAVAARREEKQRLERVRRRLEMPCGQQEAARLLDEIVDSVRTNPNVRWACHALEHYQDLRDLLKKHGCGLAEATWHSRHSAFDLYGCLVQCAVRSSQCHLVVRLLDDMVAQGVSRPLSFYESTMKQLAGQKHYQLALNVYDRLAGDGLTASAVTFSCLVSFATEVGEYDRAVQFFNQLAEHSTPSIRAYMTVLRVHNKRQDWDSSIKIFRQMQEKNAAIDSLALNVVLSTGVAADKVDEVDALVREGSAAKPKRIDVVSYNTLIKGFIQRSDLSAAIECLDRMKNDDIRPNCITFNSMMDRAMRSLHDDKAWFLYEKMRECSLKPDKVTCSVLIKGLGKSPPRGQLESSLHLLEQAGSFCDATMLGNLQSLVIDAAARSGETELLALAQQMYPRGRA